MQNLPSSRAGYMDEWLSCLLLFLWFRYFSRSCLHSLIVAYQNPLWFQWELNGAIWLLFIWIFDQGNEIPSMTLNSHFSISEKRLGPNRLTSCSGFFFNNFITQYALLKWSLSHPAKAKCNKSLINHLMKGICIGSSYIKKIVGCETQKSYCTICACSLVLENYINLFYSHYIVISLIS